jgi:hypothetical protein
MEEIRIILRKPVTFTCRIVSGMVMVAAPLIDAWRDRNFDDIPPLTWLVFFLAVVGAAANTAAAWFSTSAGRARDELQAEETT